LGTVVTTTEKNINDQPVPDEIDPITRPIINAEFAHAFADWPYIPRISCGETVNAVGNSSLGAKSFSVLIQSA
jgi:hypothetical protein